MNNGVTGNGNGNGTCFLNFKNMNMYYIARFYIFGFEKRHGVADAVPSDNKEVGVFTPHGLFSAIQTRRNIE